jgi:hypothetical protein
MLDAGRWTLDAGRWTLDAGRWTLDAGRWTLDAGRWTLDAGRSDIKKTIDIIRVYNRMTRWALWGVYPMSLKPDFTSPSQVFPVIFDTYCQVI